MPNYHWICECGFELEELVLYKQRTEYCPNCGKKLEQKYSKAKAIWKCDTGTSETKS